MSNKIIDMYKIAHDNNRALSIMLELNNTCNVRCKHCYIPEHQDYGLSTDIIKRIIKESNEIGVFNVSLTGGEIFLRDDILEIIEYIRSLGMRVFLLSNGILLTEEIVKSLSEQHISEFSTTLFSLDNAVHDFITGMQGSLFKTLNNLHMLKKYGVKVKVKMPLMILNKDSLKNLEAYCLDNNFDFYTSPIIFSKLDGDNSTHKLRLSEDEMVEVIKDVDRIMRNDLVNVPLGFDDPCGAIFYSFSVDCKGDVYPCNSFGHKIGDISHSSIKKIWEQSIELKFLKLIQKSELTKCNSCELISLCDRCPGLTLLEEGDLYGCSSVAKQLAIARKIESERG